METNPLRISFTIDKIKDIDIDESIPIFVQIRLINKSDYHVVQCQESAHILKIKGKYDCSSLLPLEFDAIPNLQQCEFQLKIFLVEKESNRYYDGTGKLSFGGNETAAEIKECVLYDDAYDDIAIGSVILNVTYEKTPQPDTQQRQIKSIDIPIKTRSNKSSPRAKKGLPQPAWTKFRPTEPGVAAFIKNEFSKYKTEALNFSIVFNTVVCSNVPKEQADVNNSFQLKVSLQPLPGNYYVIRSKDVALSENSFLVNFKNQEVNFKMSIGEMYSKMFSVGECPRVYLELKSSTTSFSLSLYLFELLKIPHSQFVTITSDIVGDKPLYSITFGVRHEYVPFIDHRFESCDVLINLSGLINIENNRDKCTIKIKLLSSELEYIFDSITNYQNSVEFDKSLVLHSPQLQLDILKMEITFISKPEVVNIAYLPIAFIRQFDHCFSGILPTLEIILADYTTSNKSACGIMCQISCNNIAIPAVNRALPEVLSSEDEVTPSVHPQSSRTRRIPQVVQTISGTLCFFLFGYLSAISKEGWYYIEINVNLNSARYVTETAKAVRTSFGISVSFKKALSFPFVWALQQRSVSFISFSLCRISKSGLINEVVETCELDFASLCYLTSRPVGISLPFVPPCQHLKVFSSKSYLVGSMSLVTSNSPTIQDVSLLEICATKNWENNVDLVQEDNFDQIMTCFLNEYMPSRDNLSQSVSLIVNSHGSNEEVEIQQRNNSFAFSASNLKIPLCRNNSLKGNFLNFQLFSSQTGEFIGRSCVYVAYDVIKSGRTVSMLLPIRDKSSRKVCVVNCCFHISSVQNINISSLQHPSNKFIRISFTEGFIWDSCWEDNVEPYFECCLCNSNTSAANNVESNAQAVCSSSSIDLKSGLPWEASCDIEIPEVEICNSFSTWTLYILCRDSARIHFPEIGYTQVNLPWSRLISGKLVDQWVVMTAPTSENSDDLISKTRIRIKIQFIDEWKPFDSNNIPNLAIGRVSMWFYGLVEGKRTHPDKVTKSKDLLQVKAFNRKQHDEDSLHPIFQSTSIHRRKVALSNYICDLLTTDVEVVGGKSQIELILKLKQENCNYKTEFSTLQSIAIQKNTFQASGIAKKFEPIEIPILETLLMPVAKKELSVPVNIKRLGRLRYSAIFIPYVCGKLKLEVHNINVREQMQCPSFILRCTLGTTHLFSNEFSFPTSSKDLSTQNELNVAPVASVEFDVDTFQIFNRRSNNGVDLTSVKLSLNSTEHGNQIVVGVGYVQTAALYFLQLRSIIGSTSTSRDPSTEEMDVNLYSSQQKSIFVSAQIKVKASFSISSINSTVIQLLTATKFRYQEMSKAESLNAKFDRTELTMKKVFEVADKDGSGGVSSSELTNLLIRTKDKSSLIKLDDNAVLLLKELMTAICGNSQLFELTEDMVSAIFHVLDVDGDGIVTWWEWKKVLELTILQHTANKSPSMLDLIDPLIISIDTAQDLLALHQQYTTVKSASIAILPHSDSSLKTLFQEKVTSLRTVNSKLQRKLEEAFLTSQIVTEIAKSVVSPEMDERGLNHENIRELFEAEHNRRVELEYLLYGNSKNLISSSNSMFERNSSNRSLMQQIEMQQREIQRARSNRSQLRKATIVLQRTLLKYHEKKAGIKIRDKEREECDNYQIAVRNGSAILIQTAYRRHLAKVMVSSLRHAMYIVCKTLKRFHMQRNREIQANFAAFAIQRAWKLKSHGERFKIEKNKFRKQQQSVRRIQNRIRAYLKNKMRTEGEPDSPAVEAKATTFSLQLDDLSVDSKLEEVPAPELLLAPGHWILKIHQDYESNSEFVVEGLVDRVNKDTQMMTVLFVDATNKEGILQIKYNSKLRWFREKPRIISYPVIINKNPSMASPYFASCSNAIFLSVDRPETIDDSIAHWVCHKSSGISEYGHVDVGYVESFDVKGKTLNVVYTDDLDCDYIVEEIFLDEDLLWLQNSLYNSDSCPITSTESKREETSVTKEELLTCEATATAILSYLQSSDLMQVPKPPIEQVTGHWVIIPQLVQSHSHEAVIEEYLVNRVNRRTRLVEALLDGKSTQFSYDDSDIVWLFDKENSDPLKKPQGDSPQEVLSEWNMNLKAGRNVISNYIAEIMNNPNSDIEIVDPPPLMTLSRTVKLSNYWIIHPKLMLYDSNEVPEMLVDTVDKVTGTVEALYNNKVFQFNIDDKDVVWLRET